jgi:MscS family membrane protein
MKSKFTFVFRGYLLLLVAFLGWALWTNAQDKAATNASVNVPSALQTGSATNNSKVETRGETEKLTERKIVLTFGLDQVAFLQTEIPEGIPLWKYLASLIYIFLAFAVSKLLDILIRGYLRQWAERTKSKFDDLLIAIVNGPIKIVCFVVFLNIGLQFFDWPKVIQDVTRKSLTIVVAISLTYMAVRLVDLLMTYWKARAAAETDRAFDEQLFPIIRKTLKAFLVVVAVLLTSQNLGLNITSLIASLSIGGLALGLAAQDTLANLFGAVAVFVDKPFRIGDHIKLDAVEGVVETIGLRSTRVRNPDGHLIAIPNKTMGNATITNITRRSNIKTEMNLGITYDTATDKVKRALAILGEVYRSHPMTHDVIISFNKFADSSLNIQVVHWWNSTDQRAYLAGIQEMNLIIKERFEQEGINFAFPTKTLLLKQDSDFRVSSPPSELKTK